MSPEYRKSKFQLKTLKYLRQLCHSGRSMGKVTVEVVIPDGVKVHLEEENISISASCHF